MAVKYSILADVELNTKSVKQQLKKASQELKIDIDVDKVGKAKKEFDGLHESVESTNLSFQAANEIFSKSIDIISSMVEQVYKLDAAQIEFQKVSDLSGKSLDNYIDKLTVMGGQVARTGKPKSQAPIVRMVN